MIGTIDIEVQAARPECPLAPVRAFVGSPSSVRVRNVPRKVGEWSITKVYVSANYPDNSTVSKECKLVGCVYVATLTACQVVGVSALGFSVTADGVDENGNDVAGYVLAKGDLEILTTDGTVTPGVTTHYIHVLPAAPTNPKAFDCYCDSGRWMIYNGTEWITLGGVSAGNAYIESPVSAGGDGLWHKMYVVDGTIAYESQGISEPPIGVDRVWVREQIAAHTSRTDNPHAVTKAQVGLGNCDNTSDLAKPVSTATQAYVTNAIDAALENATKMVMDECLYVGNVQTKPVINEVLHLVVAA